MRDHDPAKRVFGEQPCGCEGQPLGASAIALALLARMIIMYGVAAVAYRVSDAVGPSLAAKISQVVSDVKSGDILGGLVAGLTQSEITDLENALPAMGLAAVQNQSRTAFDPTTGMPSSFDNELQLPRDIMAQQAGSIAGWQQASIPQIDGDTVGVEGIDDLVKGISIDVDARGLGVLWGVISQITTMNNKDRCRVICAMKRALLGRYGSEVHRPRIPAADRIGSPELKFAPWDLADQWQYLLVWERKWGCNCGGAVPA